MVPYGTSFDVFNIFLNFKGTLMQIWKSPYMLKKKKK